MLKFKNYLSERDLWLERWNAMAVNYGLTEFMYENVSPKTQLDILQQEMFPRITSKRGIKEYIHAAGEIFGIEFNKNILQKQLNRIGAPINWMGNSLKINSKEFEKFLNRVLPNNTTIISTNDTVTVDGVSYSNESSSYLAFVVDFDVTDKYPTSKKLQYPLLLAGLQKQSVGTDNQELGFLFSIAASYITENDIFNLEIWKNQCKKMIFYDGKKTYTEQKISQIYSVAVSSEWNQSIVNGVKAVRNKLGNNVPKEFHKDGAKFFLNNEAKRLYEKEGKYTTDWNNDKWNAADVWFIYDSTVKTKEYGSLIELNNFLKTSLKSKSGVIGLSLKKFEKGGSVKEVDADKSFKSVESFQIKFGKLFTQGIKQTLVLIDPSDNKEGLYSIDYRLFQGKAGELMTGNINKKGTEAAHGKVFLKYIDSVTNTTAITSTVNKMRGSGNIEYRDGRYFLTKGGQSKFKLAKRMFKFLKSSEVVSSEVSAKTGKKPLFLDEYKVFGQGVEDFENTVNEYIGSSMKGSTAQIIKKMDVRLSATFQNIAFGGWWVILERSKKQYGANEVARKMFFYGMSMSDFSSVHLKIGG